MEVTISIKNTKDAEEFVSIVSAYNYDIDLKRGSILIDAKSLIGVMGLLGPDKIKMIIHTETCNDLINRIEKFCS